MIYILYLSHLHCTLTSAMIHPYNDGNVTPLTCIFILYIVIIPLGSIFGNAFVCFTPVKAYPDAVLFFPPDFNTLVRALTQGDLMKK